MSLRVNLVESTCTVSMSGFGVGDSHLGAAIFLQFSKVSAQVYTFAIRLPWDFMGPS